MSRKIDAYESEFFIRYRLPRPVSKSYEAVQFSSEPHEKNARISWCADVAVRFLSSIRQAEVLCENAGSPYNPPTINDFRTGEAMNGFIPELKRVTLNGFAMLGEIRRDRDAADSYDALVAALKGLEFMKKYRLCVSEGGTLTVLLGPRIEYPAFGIGLPVETANGSVFLLNTDTYEYLSLGPLAIWKKSATDRQGRLYFLRKIEGTRGYYSEDGMSGSPRTSGEISGRPHRGFIPQDNIPDGTPLDPPARFKDGSDIDGYHVYGIIWRGGTSDIYVSRRDGGEKPVVLKTFERRGAGFDENYWRFINEEKFTRGINHPGVIVPEKARSSGYGHMFEQGFIQRGSVGDLLESKGVLSMDVSAGIIKQVLDNLRAVHSSGIIHNDIKPDNLLFDENGRVSLIDFGIAYSATDSERSLKPGVPAGSPGFMAPELKTGAAPSVQSDLYSVGVLFALMSGGSIPESAESARGLRSIPRRFHVFMEKCLDMDPSARYGSADEALASFSEIEYKDERYITLDIEGTLVDNYYGRHPRPGLYNFLSFCIHKFDRIFIYSLLDERQTHEVFSELAEKRSIPRLFLEIYEHVDWPRGRDGSVKDLRRCMVPLERNAIVDDMREMIPDDQIHRWIMVEDFNSPDKRDGWLLIARNDIESRFRMP